MKTALIAGVPETTGLFSQALSSHFELRHCFSLKEAKEALNDKIDLIVCEVAFDHFQIGAFLREVKNNPAKKDVPFVVVDATTNSPPFLVKQNVLLSKDLAASGFIEVNEWRKHLGDAAAADNLRMFIDGMMNFSKGSFWNIGNITEGYTFHRT